MPSETYQLEHPEPFEEVTGAISDMLDSQYPDYVSPQPTQNENGYEEDMAGEAYEFFAMEYEAFSPVLSPLVRGPHYITFAVPQQEMVDTVEVEHWMDDSAVYERVVGDKSGIVDEMMDDALNRM